MEFWVIPALLEGLTQYHPRLPEPMAALATHFEASPTRTNSLSTCADTPPRAACGYPMPIVCPWSSLAGKRRSPAGIPACWSDGHPITAHDFVYSWRRFLDPETAGPMAYQLYLRGKCRGCQYREAPPAGTRCRSAGRFHLPGRVAIARTVLPATDHAIHILCGSAAGHRRCPAARRRNFLDVACAHGV